MKFIQARWDEGGWSRHKYHFCFVSSIKPLQVQTMLYSHTVQGVMFGTLGEEEWRVNKNYDFTYEAP
jgi:hypothetical protein